MQVCGFSYPYIHKVVQPSPLSKPEHSITPKRSPPPLSRNSRPSSPPSRAPRIHVLSRRVSRSAGVLYPGLCPRASRFPGSPRGAEPALQSLSWVRGRPPRGRTAFRLSLCQGRTRGPPRCAHMHPAAANIWEHASARTCSVLSGLCLAMEPLSRVETFCFVVQGTAKLASPRGCTRCIFTRGSDFPTSRPALAVVHLVYPSRPPARGSTRVGRTSLAHSVLQISRAPHSIHIKCVRVCVEGRGGYISQVSDLWARRNE